jgi:hypothetical protein
VRTIWTTDTSSLRLYKEENTLRDWKNVLIHPWAPHTYDFIVLTSTHPRKILLVVLQTTHRWNRKSQRFISTPKHSLCFIEQFKINMLGNMTKGTMKLDIKMYLKKYVTVSTSEYHKFGHRIGMHIYIYIYIYNMKGCAFVIEWHVESVWH